jgi:hypothetical protein
MNAYHLFIQAGAISQGLLQYLAAVAPEQVWSSFGSWLRTIRPGVAPSEFVVATALRQSLPEFLALLSFEWVTGPGESRFIAYLLVKQASTICDRAAVMAEAVEGLRLRPHPFHSTAATILK